MIVAGAFLKTIGVIIALLVLFGVMIGMILARKK